MTAAKNNPKQVIDSLFEEALQQGASDLHIAVGSPPIIRVNGELIELQNYGETDPELAEQMILSIMSKQEQDRFIADRELDFSYEIPGKSRFRVNTHWEKEHPGLVARVVSNDIPRMDDLDFPPVVFDLLQKRQGLILVTGPTGSGKSTSLAAMINFINTERHEHIVTLEDPIEFVHNSDKSLIRQRQLYSDFLSFPEALKHVVRQDPNVIMVGEMRDLATIAAAITVAETGHLVLATLHTLNASQTIDRIVDVFPPHQQDQVRVQLSLELLGVISQQLLPTIDGGRVAAREIMTGVPAVQNLIRENKISQLKTVIQTSAAEGMTTMDQSVSQLVESGKVAKEVAMRYMMHPESLG